MVTIRIIRIGGGLGNQMFQYAFSMFFEEDEEIFFDRNHFAVKSSYDIKKVFSLKMPEVERKEYAKKDLFGFLLLGKRNFFAGMVLNAGLGVLRAAGLYDYFRLKMTSVFLEERDKKISSVFEYHPRENLEDYKTFVGCFQNPKYFDHKRKRLLKDFRFPEIKGRKNREIARKIKKCNSVSVHVRLGDYTDSVNAPVYFNLSESDYYDRAVEWVKEKVESPVFFVFSDDVKKARKLFGKLKKCYFVSWNKGDSDFRDMQLMSMCRHNIIANSSFSFWGAYLNTNPGKIVVAPGRYFNKEDKICEYDKKWKVIEPGSG